MKLIDDTVKKLFGSKDQTDYDINSLEFMKQSIKNAPNISNLNPYRDSDDIIKDFLFEQTDIAKELNKIMEKFKYDS